MDGDIENVELAERPQAKLIINANKRRMWEPALCIIFINDPEEAAYRIRIALASELREVPNTVCRKREGMKTVQEIFKMS